MVFMKASLKTAIQQTDKHNTCAKLYTMSIQKFVNNPGENTNKIVVSTYENPPAYRCEQEYLVGFY